MASRKISCDLLLPEPIDAAHDGCPIKTKRRHVSVAKGQCGVVQWTMRWPDGATADFSDCVSEASVASESAEEDSVSNSLDDLAEDMAVALLVGFQGCNLGEVLAKIEGTVVDSEAGLVQFQIPAAVCQQAGIYRFEAGVFIGEALAFSDTGLISVEPGIWGDVNQRGGPPTIQEIRLHLRDRPEENDLLMAVEFDDAEILDAISKPVMQFNELPPPIQHYSCRNFPFRYHWLNAIVSELLRTAAHHYVRNKLQATGAGLSVDDKDKNDDYLRIAKMYRDEWMDFIVKKKASINMSAFSGSVPSGYSYL